MKGFDKNKKDEILIATSSVIKINLEEFTQPTCFKFLFRI